MIFSDGVPYINKNLNFGESIEKTFTIENEGTIDAIVKMSWLNIINTYLNGSLTYTLSYSETEDGEYSNLVTNKNVPRSSEENIIELANGLFVPSKTKYYYKLNITLNYTDFDQTADLKAMLSTNFILEEGGYKITFNNGDGTTTTKLVSKNSTYGKLPTPTRDGYVFLGWFTKTTGGEQITSETPFTLDDDQTLYARWETINDYNTKQTIAKLNIKPKTGSPNFYYVATTDEGVYSMQDDYGTSYYYRGNINYNYVKFANFYWRIVRINGDGSLRMIYDGTKAWTNGEASTSRMALTRVPYNNYNNDAKYVGYMYGGSPGQTSTSRAQAVKNETNSNIKTNVDNWYKVNIFNKGYDNYIADSIFCNDRSLVSGPGYGDSLTYYSARNRIGIANGSSNPSLKCKDKNDAFTQNDTTKGNGNLTYKVALITADELVAAGAKMWTSNGSSLNEQFYLYKYSDGYYWTMTPRDFGDYENVPYVFESYNHMDVAYPSDTWGAGVAPVINLTPDTVSTLIGTGVSTDPYRLPGDTA